MPVQQATVDAGLPIPWAGCSTVPGRAKRANGQGVIKGGRCRFDAVCALPQASISSNMHEFIVRARPCEPSKLEHYVSRCCECTVFAC